MKNTKSLSVIFLIYILLNCSCNKQQANVDNSGEISIIGIDPCTKSYPTGTLNKGYVLKLNNSTNDTVLTYNLPMSIAERADPIINKIANGFLLPQDSIFKTTFNYRYATDQEKYILFV